jgi:hypothetical protein
LERDGNGEIAAPDAPGLGIEISPEGARPYLRDVRIEIDGQALFRTSVLEYLRCEATIPGGRCI